MAYLTIVQTPGAGAAPAGGTLEDAWDGREIAITAPGGDTYQHEILDATDGSPPALSTPTSQTARFTPTGGRRAYRYRATVNVGGVRTSYTRTIHVSRDVDGVEIFGCYRIASGERSGERNDPRGLAAVWDENFERIDAAIGNAPAPTVTKVSGETLQGGALNLLEDDGAGSPTFILPAPVSWRRIAVKRLDQAAASVSISVSGGALIDGAATYTLVGTDVAAEFWSDGTNVYVGPNDVGGGGGPALSGAAPQSVAILASAGVSADASRADHVHPHGNLSASGALHAAATTSINGFMSSADKTKLDASTSAATANALCQRDASGFLAVSRLTTPDLRAASGLDIGGSPIVLGAPTIEIADAIGGNQIAVCSVGAAARVEIQDFCTSFELRWAASASGVGADTIVQSQAGASGSRNGFLRLRNPSGNTVLGGGVIVDVGSVVSNVSDPFAVEANTTRLLTVLQGSANETRIRNGADGNTITLGGSTGASGNSLSIIPNAAVTLLGAAGYLYLACGGATPLYVNASTGIQIWPGTPKAFLGIPSTTTITTATTTTILSWTTTSNRVYQVEAYVTASNDTDNQGAAYFLRAAFKNVSGTVTQIGTTIVTVVGEDAGQTGLDATIDFSGTALRVRFVTDAADTVVVECLFNVYVGVLT